MHTQLGLAMSEMPKQHQEKKGCDGLLYENMQCYCDQLARLVGKRIPMSFVPNTLAD